MIEITTEQDRINLIEYSNNYIKSNYLIGNDLTDSIICLYQLDSLDLIENHSEINYKCCLQLVEYYCYHCIDKEEDIYFECIKTITSKFYEVVWYIALYSINSRNLRICKFLITLMNQEEINKNFEEVKRLKKYGDGYKSLYYYQIIEKFKEVINCDYPL